jgi:hypothetical protein
MPTSIHTYQKYPKPSGDPVPLNAVSSGHILYHNITIEMFIGNIYILHRAQ